MHTSNYNYKYTFSVEVAPLCKVRTGRLLGRAGMGPLACAVKRRAELSWLVLALHPPTPAKPPP